jgi:kynureninase
MKPDLIASDFAAGSGIYLLSHSVGRPLQAAPARLAEKFFSPWLAGEGEPWGAWLNVINDFQQALCALFNSPAENFCPQSNLSSALSKILFSLPARTGRSKILLSEHDFPSIGFVAEQATRQGYELCFLPANADHTDAQVWADALTPEVQWLIITQVQSNTGVQTPVMDILAAARRRDVLTVVDVAQSAGILPIDLEAWQADFVLGSCVKWLCGGPGAGFLWVNPALVGECRPLDVGWFSHANPFEFDIHHFEYHPGALRFWGGTPSVMPYLLAAESIHYIAAIGVEHIRRHNLALTQQLVEALPRSALVSPLDPHKRSGTLILNFGPRQAECVARLKQAQVRFDARRAGMRLSPHIYNRPEEMEQVAAILQTQTPD